MKYLGLISLNINFCSSFEPWPDVCTLLTLDVITLAPSFDNKSIFLFIDNVFPGIAELAKITVSVGIIVIFLCVPFAILLNAASSSPWVPVHKISNLFGSTWLRYLLLTNVSLGALIYPNSVPILIAFSIERPNTTIFLPCSIHASTTCLTRYTLEAKVAKITLCFSLRSILEIVFPTSFSLWVNSVLSEFVESESKHNTPCSPIAAILCRLDPCPTGVKSNLKSPVWTIFPWGVFTITPNESGIEWVVLWNETFRYL